MSAILICFQDPVRLGPLGVLRRGFRHCTTCLHIERRWVVLDPLWGGLVVDLVGEIDPITLASGFAAAGAGVLLAERPSMTPSDRATVGPMTCVEVAKRVLGLRAPGVVTPRQLYQRLARPKEKVDRGPF
ncbi:MAG: hypothetical protein KDG89_12610 [Geminicoccaceae bacterium]|nr:hypothetical protein [Geminicoccaceae bacterium]